jgi:hypothetical protein
MALMPYQPTILELGDGDVEPQFIISKQKNHYSFFHYLFFHIFATEPSVTICKLNALPCLLVLYRVTAININIIAYENFKISESTVDSFIRNDFFLRMFKRR